MSIDFYPFLIKTAGGQSVTAEWGRVPVPETRTNPSGRTIELALVRIKGRGRRSDTPIFHLMGGPGISVLANLRWIADQLPDREALGDLILLEPRGVGHSRPRLDCPGTYDLPLDQPTGYSTALEGHRNYVSQAVDYWRSLGVDLGGYNAREMAADVDAVRRVLGYASISITGGSFGSHLGIAVMRYFGNFVERAFLWGIEGPNHTLKLPGLVQHKLEALNRLLRDDRGWHNLVPDLLNLMAEMLDRLDRQPVTVQLPGSGEADDVNVTAGKFDLQWVTTDKMGNSPFLRALPQRYHEMAEGDFTWLAAESRRLRTGLESNLTYELVDCASGATADRWAQVQREAPTTLLENAINETLFGVCDLLGVPDLGGSFRGDLISDVPTLLVAGNLDPRTPLENAREVLAGLTNGQILAVDGASHDLAWRGSHVPALKEIRDAFLAGRRIGTRTLSAGFEFDPIPVE